MQSGSELETGFAAAGCAPSTNAGDKGSMRPGWGHAALSLASLMLITDSGEANSQALAQSGDALPPIRVTTPKPARARQPSAPPPRAAQPAPTAPQPGAAAAPSGVAAGGPAEGEVSPNGLQATTGLDRLPGTIQSTPQVVNVVPREILQQQGVQTLDQALRNVPGVTVAIGEGNGGLNGDQFRIRGFDAKGDIYVDGLRDFGVYVRDSFNFDSVQVFKGPSSETFGAGTTGGVINILTKQAKLGSFYGLDGQFGSGNLTRGTFDVNHQMSPTSAFRVTGMVHEQDVPDRDHVRSDRWGVATSAVFGVGTDTNWTLSQFHQHNDRTPDYGVPFVTPAGTTIGRPVTEFGVPRSTFYGKDTDRDVTDVHMFTSKFSTKANDWLTLHNDTRVSFFNRDFATSVPGCDAVCSAAFFAGGNPTLAFGGGNPAYRQESRAIQNLTSAVANFNTGIFRHQVVAGLDVYYVEDQRQGLLTAGTKAGQPILSPIYASGGLYSLQTNPQNVKKADGTAVGVFASDRLYLTEQFSILGGLRYDNYEATYNQTAAPTATNLSGVTVSNTHNEFLNPKLSFIFEPTKQQTYYVSYATAATPPGQFITNAPSPITSTQPSLTPETSESYEAGAKISVFDGKLGFTGAVFQITKSNATFSDPVTGDLVATGERQRAQGAEFGMSGRVTNAWTVNVAYAYIESEILTSAVVPSTKGNEVQGVPRNSASLFTTYNLSTLINTGPGKLTVGGGVYYRDKVFTSSANIYQVPATFSFDAFVSYEWDKYRVAVNGYNLTDELNYDQFFNSRATPSSGRTVMVTAAAKW